jgi:hypothetical protein
VALELKKVSSVLLRAVGLNEKWLQDRIREDTSLLGLGELEIFSQEHQQPVGGRIDFLMRNSTTEVFYEVEVMLGTLDESHIVRTIEYWDVERQRRPTYEHQAVIVAENITSRFFNILRLLNRSVPMIAVQLNAFRISENDIALHAVTVLNVNKEIQADEDEVAPSERKNRQYWQSRRSPDYLSIIDEIASLFQPSGHDPLTYNRHHIALGTTGYNFCWFSPRKSGWQVRCRLSADTRDAALNELQAGGFDDASPRHDEYVRFDISGQISEVQKSALADVLKRAEEWSNR